MTAEDLEGAKTAIREKKEDKETKNELQKVRQAFWLSLVAMVTGSWGA